KAEFRPEGVSGDLLHIVLDKAVQHIQSVEWGHPHGQELRYRDVRLLRASANGLPVREVRSVGSDLALRLRIHRRAEVLHQVEDIGLRRTRYLFKPGIQEIGEILLRHPYVVMLLPKLPSRRT